MRRTQIFCAVATLGVLTTTLARAQDSTPTQSTAPSTAREPSPKRQLPDYEGRAPPPTDEDEVGRWVLRILLSPLYFTSEYILRKPAEWMTRAAERAEIPRKLYDFFLFGPEHKLGFFPTAFVEFGFQPSVGIYGFWNDAFTLPNNDLHLHYAVWPDDFYSGSITERIHSHDNHVTLRVEGLRRPDRVFYGLGPHAPESAQSRYTETRFQARATMDLHVWRSSRIEATLGLRKVGTSPGDHAPDPSLEQQAATGAFAVPYGFNQNYLDPYTRVVARFDTRPEREKQTGSGLRVELEAEHGADVAHGSSSGWVRWGATATVFADLNDHGRILSLTGAALFSDPLGSSPIPFTELITLGGDHWMRGYWYGRLVDRSAAIAQLNYAWPVAPWLNGDIQLALGNVFAERLDGFKLGLLRLSAAIGFVSRSDPPIEMLAGFGTEPFDDGAHLNSFRLAFGVPYSF